MLLKNDGTLPFSSKIRKLALIGPYANATTSMQASYSGVAPFLISPLEAAISAGFEVVTAALDSNVSSTDTSQFAAAVEAAKQADAVIFAGGIDETIEAEQLDRDTIVWPGVQLDLIAQLETAEKPLIVLQFGGGQVDDTALKNSNRVSHPIDMLYVVRTHFSTLRWTPSFGPDTPDKVAGLQSSIFSPGKLLPQAVS